MKPRPKISILLAAYKSGDLLDKIFLPGFLNNTSIDISVELIIYDNGGNEKETLKKYDYRPYTLIGDGKNVGLNEALNACAEVAKGEYFYLPHTDMYLMPGWDAALLDALKNQPPGKQLLCSRSIEPTQGHTKFHIIEDYGKEPDEFNEDKLKSDFKDHRDTAIITGARMPFLISRSLWRDLLNFNLSHYKKAEALDSRYFSYATDNDLIINCDAVGVRSFWMVGGSLVYHLQGKTNVQQTVDKDSDKPYQMFREKWSKLGYKTEMQIDLLEQSLFPWYIKVR